MNISYILGTLTRDPEMVQGMKKPLVKLNLAVRSNYTNADGEKPVQFFNVCVWGDMAQSCYKYLRKNSKMAVLGKMQNRSWEKDGEKRYAMEIVAMEVEFISTPKKHEIEDYNDYDMQI